MKAPRRITARGLGKPTRREVERVYRILLRHQGHAGWWPGRTRFEVALGAILVQNTAWTNAEKALAALRRRRLLSFRALDPLTAAEIAPLIRSSGTFRLKARRVRAFLDLLRAECPGGLGAVREMPAELLRAKLLAVSGIGPETADSIALYAADKPVFVIDAYTRRLCSRLGWIRGNESYAQLQRLFMDRLGSDPRLFGDYHAQIVQLAKEHCRKRPLCTSCPLEQRCEKRGVR